jgi:hypothetical protein
MRYLFSIIATAFLLVTGRPSYGQRPGLKGLDKIELVIQVPNKDSQACGITKALVRDSFMYPASSAKFKLVVNHADARFHIDVIGLHTKSGMCVSAINMQVNRNQEVKLDYQKIPSFGLVQIWGAGALFMSVVSQHPQIVREQIEEITKKFITEWNLANRDKR